MGRGEKKIKADRINAIRKKYEAFLEEDKKRKERNDYILGKLDKMRSCTTLVHQQHKSNYLGETQHPALCNNPVPLPEKASAYSTYNRSTHSLNVPNLPPDIPRSESALLNEIADKYILIPKRHTNHTNHDARVIPKNHPHDSDWKRKYDILNVLKRNEKESAEDSTASANLNKYPVAHDEQLQSIDFNQILPERDTPLVNERHTMDFNPTLTKKAVLPNNKTLSFDNNQYEEEIPKRPEAHEKHYQEEFTEESHLDPISKISKRDSEYKHPVPQKLASPVNKENDLEIQPYLESVSISEEMYADRSVVRGDPLVGWNNEKAVEHRKAAADYEKPVILDDLQHVEEFETHVSPTLDQNKKYVNEALANKPIHQKEHMTGETNATHFTTGNAVESAYVQDHIEAYSNKKGEYDNKKNPTITNPVEHTDQYNYTPQDVYDTAPSTNDADNKPSTVKETRDTTSTLNDAYDDTATYQNTPTVNNTPDYTVIVNDQSELHDFTTVQNNTYDNSNTANDTYYGNAPAQNSTFDNVVAVYSTDDGSQRVDTENQLVGEPIIDQNLEEHASTVAVAGGETSEDFYGELAKSDQQGAGEGYDFSAQNVVQNDPYYYEGQEGVNEYPVAINEYPVAINEHEETQLNYDPNYEQQYLNTYNQVGELGQPTGEYETQQEYEQQVYEQQEGYEQQQELEHQQSYVQSQEQGYDQQVYDQQGYDQQVYDGQVYQEAGYQQYDNQQENYETVNDIQNQLDKEEGVIAENDPNIVTALPIS